LRALGVSSAKRTAVLPDVPTLQQAGVRGCEADLWTGMLAPAGAPPAVLSKLHAEIARANVRPN